MSKKVIKQIFSRIFGLALFIILLFLANLLIPLINSELYTNIVEFINTNLILFIVIAIVFLIADLFRFMQFPFNLASPLFDGTAAVFIVSFMFNLFEFIDMILEQNIFQIFQVLSSFIYPGVFIIVIFMEYLLIFLELSKTKDTEKQEKPKKDKQKKKDKKQVEGENKKQKVGKESKKSNSKEKKAKKEEKLEEIIEE